MPELDQRSPERSAVARLVKDPVSRRKFIAVGGGTGLAALLAACGGGGSSTTMVTNESKPTSEGMKSETEQFGKGDIGILNYALTLEYLEAEFYTRGMQGSILKGRALELVSPIRDHEQEHVAVVTQTVKDLGGKPAAKPKFTFPAGTFTSKAKFLATASAFEGRRRGSRSSSCRTSDSRSGGRSPWTRGARGRTAPKRVFWITSATSWPPKGLRPERDSNSTTPRAKRSPARSWPLPRRASGGR